jgi:hypothetical protein
MTRASAPAAMESDFLNIFFSPFLKVHAAKRGSWAA